MPIFKIFLIINMYLVAFFFLFSLNNQQNRHHHHHHFHSSVKGTGRGGAGAGRGGTERGEEGGAFRTERAQYKPQPRRLLAMMMSVTASNTTWMFPVSVAQVM